VTLLVVPPATRTVRLAIDERWISRFDNTLESIALRVSTADGRAQVFDTNIIHRTPKASRLVASAALSSKGAPLSVRLSSTLRQAFANRDAS